MASTQDHTVLERPVFDKPVKLLIVLSPYYSAIADGLLTGAKAELAAAGAAYDVVQMPGALEIPTAIGISDRRSNFDGYVALGCVIRGETTHYETVCNDSSRALQLLGLQGLCIGNGILTVETMEQAQVRGAAAAALHLIALARKWAQTSKGIGFLPRGEDTLMAGGPLGNDNA